MTGEGISSQVAVCVLRVESRSWGQLFILRTRQDARDPGTDHTQMFTDADQLFVTLRAWVQSCAEA
jgi:hypothetical protein